MNNIDSAFYVLRKPFINSYCVGIKLPCPLFPFWSAICICLLIYISSFILVFIYYCKRGFLGGQQRIVSSGSFIGEPKKYISRNAGTLVQNFSFEHWKIDKTTENLRNCFGESPIPTNITEYQFTWWSKTIWSIYLHNLKCSVFGTPVSYDLFCLY